MERNSACAAGSAGEPSNTTSMEEISRPSYSSMPPAKTGEAVKAKSMTQTKILHRNLFPIAQNRFRKRISKLKLSLREVSLLVEACSYCATKERRSETRYSTANIWFGSEATLVE